MKHPDFKIPNLDPMYEAVVNFVKEHQGEKGYIDCQPYLGNDVIYCAEYDDWVFGAIEKYVIAVRVKGEDLQIMRQLIAYGVYEYAPEDFTWEEDWVSVRWSDIYYVPTLFNIAENIWEYVEEE